LGRFAPSPSPSLYARCLNTALEGLEVEGLEVKVGLDGLAFEVKVELDGQKNFFSTAASVFPETDFWHRFTFIYIFFCVAVMEWQLDHRSFFL
jgi:hypothetical protein